MLQHLRRGLQISIVMAMVGVSSLLVAPPTLAQVPSPCATQPDAVALSLVIDVEPGQNITLVGGAGGTPPFTQTAHVTVTCTLPSPGFLTGGSVVPGAVVRVFASNSTGIDVSTANGSQTGAVVGPPALFVVTSVAGATPPCGSPASALNFCDVTTDASGNAVFTITSPTPNAAAVGPPLSLVGSHREQVRVAFGTTLVDPRTGAFIGANAGGFLFESAPAAATPELDSFVLFGAGAVALAGFAWKRRRA